MTQLNCLSRRSWLSFSLGLVLLAGVGLNGCGDSHPATEKTAEQKSDETEKSKSLPTVRTVKVEKLQLNEKISLPGELRAYQDVPIHAKVEGFISWIGVDRGWHVKRGQKMIVISCPELDEKTKEAAAKVSSARAAYNQSESALMSEQSRQMEATAKLEADSLTSDRLQKAAKTPGAIAQNEVDLAVKTVESDQARVQAMKDSVKAAKHLVAAQKENVNAAEKVLSSLKNMTSYLTVTAPFDGVITERNVHEGSIVGVSASRNDADIPLVRCQQKSLLRLVVAVPESDVAGLTVGKRLDFTVPAFLGKTFSGTVARLGFALDTKTRTMPVELNVPNDDGQLEPGMFATVSWQVTRPYKTMFVPSSAVTNDLKGTFVIKVNGDKVERLTVTKGQTMGNMVEIEGPLAEGDVVALKATDEYKTGNQVIAKPATTEDIEVATSSKAAASGE